MMMDTLYEAECDSDCCFPLSKTSLFTGHYRLHSFYLNSAQIIYFLPFPCFTIWLVYHCKYILRAGNSKDCVWSEGRAGQRRRDCWGRETGAGKKESYCIVVIDSGLCRHSGSCGDNAICGEGNGVLSNKNLTAKFHFFPESRWLEQIWMHNHGKDHFQSSASSTNGLYE